MTVGIYGWFYKETIRRSLPIHGKYHYGKDLYDYHCPICKIDFPDINHKDNQWKKQKYISDYLGITKKSIRRILTGNLAESPLIFSEWNECS